MPGPKKDCLSTLNDTGVNVVLFECICLVRSASAHSELLTLIFESGEGR